ncbi:MAG: hypothetical protein WA775_10210 [Psychroserpens sp.]|uniref:hypothetical protein n=1 Tax=Psychroserpens sp. TaxID=2020870 RepID=UPI003C97CEBA
MNNIVIELLSLYHLDVSSNKLEKTNISLKKETITNYIDSLIEEILDSPNKRLYLFKDGSTEVKNSVSKIITKAEDHDRVLLNNAKRLLEKEVKTDKKLQKTLGIKVQRGSLMQIHFKQGKSDNLLICKVEHDEILNEKSFEINRGLNTKKKVYKSFLYYLPNENRQGEIYVNDKNESKYWWDDFLELDQVKTDEYNTEESIDKIITAISSTTRKREFEFDNTILRNSVVGYYRNNKQFNFSDLIESVFENYTPIRDKYPLGRVKNKLDKLIEDDTFDNQFTIVPNKIKKRKKQTIKVGPGLVLKIEEFVNNLETVFKVYDKAGEHGMIILTDEAYNYVRGNVRKDN